MDNELKQLIEDAAKLLGHDLNVTFAGERFKYLYPTIFNPLDPERGDLWKVAEAAELRVDYQTSTVTLPVRAANDLATMLTFTRTDFQSQALAILRAASAVWKERQNAE